MTHVVKMKLKPQRVVKLRSSGTDAERYASLYDGTYEVPVTSADLRKTRRSKASVTECRYTEAEKSPPRF